MQLLIDKLTGAVLLAAAVALTDPVIHRDSIFLYTKRSGVLSGMAAKCLSSARAHAGLDEVCAHRCVRAHAQRVQRGQAGLLRRLGLAARARIRRRRRTRAVHGPTSVDSRIHYSRTWRGADPGITSS